MNIADLEIENYRSIKHLHVPNFRQFNLILGENNSGKTSLLEAIQFCSGMPNGILLNQMNVIRRLMGNDIFTAFHDLDETKPISFSISKNREKRKISVSSIKKQELTYNSRESAQPNLNRVANYIINVTRFDGKKYSVPYSPEQRIENPFYKPLADNEELQNTDKSIPSFFWTPDWSTYNYSNALSKIIINKKKDFIIKALQEIDNNVQDIQLGANGGIFVDIGLPSLLPITLMGQGIEKILAIITTISNLENGFVLIDEFENGLHHTSMEQLWSILFKLCKEQNIQLFVTTHSYECIESFINKADNQSQLSIIRLERNIDNTHTAVSISAEAAKQAIEQRWELR